MSFDMFSFYQVLYRTLLLHIHHSVLIKLQLNTVQGERANIILCNISQILRQFDVGFHKLGKPSLSKDYERISRSCIS